MLEEIMSVAVRTRTPRYRPAWMRDEALRSARTCYDHLAGRLGVALPKASPPASLCCSTKTAARSPRTGRSFSTNWGWTLRAPPASAAAFAGLASIGASAGRISAVRSVRRWRGIALRSAGSRASRTVGRWRSLRRAASAFVPSSRSISLPPRRFRASETPGATTSRSDLSTQKLRCTLRTYLEPGVGFRRIAQSLARILNTWLEPFGTAHQRLQRPPQV